MGIGIVGGVVGMRMGCMGFVGLVGGGGGIVVVGGLRMGCAVE